MALTIAGSDSGGGAGIQADLKTFAALGVYGASALTAVTAQNTLGVRLVEELTPAMVAAQIDAVAEDIGVDAAKTGMLSNAEIVAAVAERVRRHRIGKLVVDPVMVAKSGDRLLRADALRALREALLPLALVVTPNLPEAEALTGLTIADRDGMVEAGRRIAAMGPRYVLVKGGHAPGGDIDDGSHEPVDVLVGRAGDGGGNEVRVRLYGGEWIDTRNTHGTGCTLSAAIAALLARGLPVEDAVGRAKEYLTAALRAAYPVGHGYGPPHHLHALPSSDL